MATAEGKVKIRIEAEDKTGGAFDSAFGNISKLGKTAALGIAGGALLAGAAIAGVATKGVMEFVKFEDQLNEVFTLLPGISGPAMRQMQEQVLDVSVGMGRLPNEIIPALYQSLSAGVPQDNVFEFLEVAHKASLGGVTELTTAVDGITSVVNAYGAETIGASKASDIMFTAVRLGKTDFNQLSSSLFNVIPTAASLGVSFEDISATLATLTGQGTPTSVATTQIRAALVEASKGGSKLDLAIQGLTGSTFPELIKQGDSMPSIFESLRSSMPDQEFKDLFGSVEAVNAVLGITGPNFDKTVSAMEEMADSAGATEAAYDTMNKGMARTFEVLKAKAAVSFIRIGDALAPLVEMIGDKLFEALAIVEPILMSVIGTFGNFFDGLRWGEDLVESIKGLIMELMGTFGFAESDIEAFASAFESVQEFLSDLIPKIQEFTTQVWAVLEPIIEAVLQFVSWKDILIILGAVIAAVIIAALISIVQFIAPIIAIVAVVVGAVALLRTAWESNFLGIQDKTKVVMDFIKEKIETVVAFVTLFWAVHGDEILAKAQEIWNTILEVISFVIDEISITVNLVMEALREFWEENGENILFIAETIWTSIKNFIDTTIHTIQTIIETVSNAIKEFWAAYGQHLIDIAQAFWDSIQQVFETILDLIGIFFQAWRDVLAGDWEAFGTTLRDFWDTAWQAIQEIITRIGGEVLEFFLQLMLDIIAGIQEVDWQKLGEDIIMGLKEGVIRKAKKLLDAVIAALRAAWNAAKAFIQSRSPSELFAELGQTIPEGMAVGIAKSAGAVTKQVQEMMKPTISAAGLPGVSGNLTSGATVINNFNNNNTINANYVHEQSEGRIIDDLRVAQLLRN